MSPWPRARIDGGRSRHLNRPHLQVHAPIPCRFTPRDPEAPAAILKAAEDVDRGIGLAPHHRVFEPRAGQSAVRTQFSPPAGLGGPNAQVCFCHVSARTAEANGCNLRCLCASGSKAQLLRMHIRVYLPGASTCIAKQLRVRIEDTATMERTKMLARAVQLEACQLQYPRMTRTSVRSARGTRDSTASPATCSSVESACRDHVPFKPIRKQAGSRTPAHDMKKGWTQASRSVGVSGR